MYYTTIMTDLNSSFSILVGTKDTATTVNSPYTVLDTSKDLTTGQCMNDLWIRWALAPSLIDTLS